MYAAAFGATIIILDILAGVKPLERRFLAVQQQRSIHVLVDPGSMSLDGCTEFWATEVCA
ncbi:hypothetical protein SAMN05446635_0023 [Burkholderia sp. OK233]|nr:hypothetical protein SAMN05446635_0023 [Burkholderia sp. OK233]